MFYVNPIGNSSKNVVFCCDIGARNKLEQKEKVDAQKAWENALKMGKPVSEYMRICSLHFTKEDYFPMASKLILKCASFVIIYC